MNAPLGDLDEWEDDLRRRYPSPANTAADSSDSHEDTTKFRDYEAEARPSVRQFYELNHRYQTLDFVRQKHAQFLGLQRRRMGIWEAMEYLNQLVDDSDPDIELPQIEHLLQTAEAVRADGHPRWFILTGLIHDLGKILCLWGEPQWAVVGDTFPVGCAYSESIVFYEAFQQNPDFQRAEYQTEYGIYEPHCGLDRVLMSWGHDEYLYQVVKDYLPPEALAMIRYHSCYPIHRERAYQQLLTEEDQSKLDWVRRFNRYDLYTKCDQRMDVDALKPFYVDLINEFFPPVLNW